MCGILAWLAPHGAPAVDPGLLDRMNARHALRGPDHQACFVPSGDAPRQAGGDHAQGPLDGRLGMAHARLSILDLDPRSHQPMFDAEGRHAIVFNGEIYNYRQVADDLKACGLRLRTTSDTEVLLLALRQWGESALERLEGMFAFVFADLHGGWLLAARDRLGIKPLYMARGPFGTAFASTLAPLCLLPGFAPRIDPVARFEMLAAKCVYGPRTIYQGVEKVPPGCLVRVDAHGECDTRRYWSPRFETALPDTPATVDALEQALTGAVRRQLVADVPVGVFLSGGVDSSLVAALAQRETSGIDSFSVGFEDPRYDESPHAQAVARHLGTRHHALRVDASTFRDTLQDIWQAYDEPFGDASAVPTLLVSRLAREHVTVALSGDGGDELFLGYTRHHQLARWHGAARCIPAPLRRMAASVAARMPTTFAGRAILGLLGFTRPEDAYYHFCHNAYPHVAGRLCGQKADDLRTAGSFLMSAWAGREAPDLARAMQLADLAGYMPDDCLTKVDRASMACSLEVRVPLLDEDVVRMALALPPSACRKASQGKRILREILWRHVPRKLVERPKQGFGVPLESWLMGDMRQWTLDLLCPAHLREAEIDPQGVEWLLRRFEQGQAPALQYVLWPLCAYICWFLGQKQRLAA